MERLSKEELRARQLEQQAREQHTLFAQSIIPSSDAEPLLVQRHYAQQRLRLEVYEHQLRNALVVAESSAFSNNLVHAWRSSSVSVAVQLRAVQDSETTWRAAVQRETAMTMERLFKILNRVFADAVEQAAKEGAETADMKSLAIEEKELRRRVQEQSAGAAASAVLAAIEPEEKAWRSFIFRDYGEAATKLWSRLLGARFLWLLSPAGGAGGALSEAESRLHLMRQEWFSRAAAAVRFCQLQLQWHESWQRMTRQFVEKLNFHYTRLAFRIWGDETAERKALRMVYEPLSIDIREQVAENLAKKNRCENKMAALKNLRSLELTRASAARFESDDFVAVWRARELAEIEALHNQILGSVASFYTGGGKVKMLMFDGDSQNNNNNNNDEASKDALGEALGAKRRRSSTVDESPEIQKLRAFASSVSPIRNRSSKIDDRDGRGSPSRNQQLHQDPASSSAATFVMSESGKAMPLSAVLKLDQAVIDLHGHHEDVMVRLKSPTTSFDDIVEYRKSLQAKSGPKLSSQAEMEVKQLRGQLNAEIAHIHKQTDLRSKRGGSVTSFSSGAAVVDALLGNRRQISPPPAAAAAAAATASTLPLTAQSIAQLERNKTSLSSSGGVGRGGGSGAAATAAVGAFSSPSPVRVELQSFVRDGNVLDDEYDDDRHRHGRRYEGSPVYDEESLLRHRVKNGASASLEERVGEAGGIAMSDNMTLQAVRDWCLQSARQLSHSP